MDKRSKTQFAILGFLSDGPKSGYDIKKSVEASTGNFWQESFGQIYPVLRRLTATGLVGQLESSPQIGRQRHVYRITPDGRRAFRAWFGEATSEAPLRNELLLKIFFGRFTEPAIIRSQMADFVAQQRLEIDHLASIRRDVAEFADAPDYPYWIMTIEHGESVREAGLAWADGVLARLLRLESATGSRSRRSGSAKTKKPTRRKKQKGAKA